MLYFISAYALSSININNVLYTTYRVFGSFTMETILATAFGRQMNLQRGESDELSEAVGTLVGSFSEGQIEKVLLMNSTSHAVL